MEKETKPSQKELLTLLQNASLSLGKIYIVIDALDELSDDAKEDLLRSLWELHAGLLLTSRPLDLFMDMPHNPDPVHLHLTDQVEEDIELFVSNKLKNTPRLERLFRGNPQLLKEISQKIKEKSNNM